MSPARADRTSRWLHPVTAADECGTDGRPRRLGRPAGRRRLAVTRAERGERRHRGGHQEDRHQRAGQPAEPEPHHERDGEAERTRAPAGGTRGPTSRRGGRRTSWRPRSGRRARRRRSACGHPSSDASTTIGAYPMIGPKIGTTAHTPTQIASTLVPGRPNNEATARPTNPLIVATREQPANLAGARPHAVADGARPPAGMIAAEDRPRQPRAVDERVQHEHDHEQRLETESGAVGRIGAAEDDLRGQLVEVLLDALGDPSVDEELADRRVGIDRLDALRSRPRRRRRSPG